MQLRGLTAVVVGGAGTIGSAIVDSLRRERVTVVPWDVRPAEGIIVCDVSDEESVADAFDRTIDESGTPTILVNVAGIAGPRAVLAAEAIDDRWSDVLGASIDWRRIFDTNVIGCLNSSREFVRRVSAAGLRSSIVNISSIASGAMASPRFAAYSASKVALNMLTRLAAVDFAPLGVRVNAIAPGVMEVGMAHLGVGEPSMRSTEWLDMIARATPIEQRLGRASDIAEAVIALLNMDWVTGQVVFADGGLSSLGLF